MFAGFNFDLAICLEVAEHILEINADQVIKNVCQDAKILFFSAAPPGQGGYNHFNEKEQNYWIEKIKKEGMELAINDTVKATGILKKAKVKEWYTNNLLIFKRK